MAYITGSVTDANPGPALYALMAPALTTAGFTLVDTVVISTRTHKVWKSPAAGNVQNLDWYLDIGYTTAGAGNVTLWAFEYFDPATDLGFRGPHANIDNTVDATTFSRYGATGQTLESALWFQTPANTQMPLTTGTFGYWASCTAERVCLLLGTQPTVTLYAGFYEPDPLHSAKVGAALYPLYTGYVGAGTSTNSTGALSRIPPVTSLGAATWNHHVACVPVDSTIYPLLPTGPVTGYPIVGSRIALQWSVSNPPRVGRFGWLRDCFMVPTSGVVRGDTCTISGASHVLSSSTGTPLSWAFKAA